MDFKQGGEGCTSRSLSCDNEQHHWFSFVQDHFRVIVKPAYTNVYRERGGVLGVVEFDTREDLERAIRKLDDTEFKNPFDRAFIRVIDESDDRGRSRSRSPRGR